jgi:multicomponent Na+:H+ antiporter subunit G
MTVIADVIMLLGGMVALLAGAGLLKFDTSYARFHAAGKASPIAFVIAAIGASFHLGWEANAYLAIGATAMILTLPVGVHLMFRAVHRTTPGAHLAIDDLTAAEATSDE